MNRVSYTYQQAITIAESFQFLKGRPYDKEYPQTTPVLDVLVVPNTEAAQLRFMDSYTPGKRLKKTTRNVNASFNVIVVASYNHDKEIFLWMDLESFVRRNIQLPARIGESKLIAIGREIAA